MSLIDVIQNTAWAIVPEKLDAIHQVLLHRMQGVKVDPTLLEAAARRKTESMYFGRIEGNLAILPVVGVLAKRMNLFMAFSGGTSTELLRNDFRDALENPEVMAIVLDIDSHGGTVDGTQALANLIFEARGEKPIVAFANGMMASAAYWIGSAADWIITEETAVVGSIGVVQVHYDYSRADERAGVKRSLIYAGRYKTVGNDTEPLTREARDVLQEGVDTMYSLFVDAVARNRDRGIGEVLENMADGRLFIGRQALDAGLVDDTGAFEDAVEIALSMAEDRKRKNKRGMAPGRREDNMLGKNKGTETIPLTLETLRADHPDLVEALQAEGAATVNLTEALSLERERILGLAGIQFGTDACDKFRAIVESGITMEQFKAVRGLEAKAPENKVTQKMEEMLEAIQSAGPENPGAGGASTGPRDFTEAWQAIKEEKKCSTEEAMKKAVKLYPDLHKAYLSKQQPAGNA
ncbi:MAG: signal peptide peptidase SppA [Deltaproteobacteria bacterium]|nr:signal peptide peptidase SppA [Deltaproteobacteria bacterium]